MRFNKGTAGLILLACLYGKVGYPQTVPLGPDEGAARRGAVKILVPAWLAELAGAMSFEADSVDVGDLELTDISIPVALTTDGVTVSDGRANSRSGALAISAAYEYASGKTQIRIQGDSLSLGNEEEEREQPDELIFGHDELIPTWLERIDGEVEVEVEVDFGVLQVHDIELRSVEARTTFADTGFSADGRAAVGEGHLTMAMQHEYANARTAVRLVGSDVPFGPVTATRDYIEDARTAFELNVTGEGKTARAFVSTMDGSVSAETGPGRINNTGLDRLGRDFLALMLSSILPIDKSPAQERLDCAALRLDFADGKAVTDHGLVMRTERLAIVGHGTVDLDAETLALEFKPHIRKGIKIGPGHAVSAITVSGRLDGPELTVRTGGLLQEGVSLGAAFATFGLSTAALSLFDWSSSPDLACAIAVNDELTDR